ncbi:MAG TPA: hypothetical protein VFA33_12640 [Bryobacteraceae bacterium]|nr:hypothetical protein [Bryobacteraceae bacterium]
MRSWLVLLGVVFGAPLGADQMFVFVARGRLYEVVTRQIGRVLEFPGHWLYEPSIVTPSGLTGGNYLLLFSSNLESGKDIDHGEAIFLSTSPNGYSQFSDPQPILTNTSVQDLCDMGDARPVWDGAQWHVYVYAVQGDYHTNKCGQTAVVFEAAGGSLTSLSWVTYPGTNQVRPIVAGTGSKGVAEDMQWFFTGASGDDPSPPFLVTYNDWGRPDTNVLASRSDGTNDLETWYDVPVAYDSDHQTLVLPDAILANTQDAAALGDPAIGLESNCGAGDGRYQYVYGIGLYNDLTPASGRPVPPAPGMFFPGSLESVANDDNGPRMFRPRLARNEYGYIVPVPDVPGLPRIWRSYLYYNDAQVGSKGECGYSRWFSSSQRFSVSYIEIREM